MLTALLTLAGASEFSNRVTINGYFSFEFENHLMGDDPKKGDEYGSFDSDLFDLVINVRPSDRVRVAADITWEHGTATEADRGNAAMEYAFAEYIHSSYLKLRAGKMFTAFGIYNEIHTAKPATLNFKEPYSTNKLYKRSKGAINYFPRWGTGLAAVGDFTLFGKEMDYILQVTNGQIEVEDQDHNPYDKDDNTDKAVGGRLRAEIAQGMQLGASFYLDTFSQYDDASGDWEIVGKGNLASYGLQCIWEMSETVGLQMEYVSGVVKQPDEDEVSRYSYTVMPSFALTDTHTLYYLYEYADPDTAIDKDSVVMHNLGINTEIDGSMYIKSELYNLKSEPENSKYKSGDEYTELRIAVVVGF